MLVIIAVDVTVSLLGYFYGADTSILTIIYIVISAGFIVFYFVTVGKITQRLKKSQAQGRRVRRLTTVMFQPTITFQIPSKGILTTFCCLG